MTDILLLRPSLHFTALFDSSFFSHLNFTQLHFTPQDRQPVCFSVYITSESVCVCLCVCVCVYASVYACMEDPT